MFDYIKKHYNVNAELYQEIEYSGKKGMIVQDCGHYLGVNFYNDKPYNVSYLHPTDNVVYLETFGKPRKLTSSQKRYRDFLNSDFAGSYKEYLGIN